MGLALGAVSVLRVSAQEGAPGESMTQSEEPPVFGNTAAPQTGQPQSEAVEPKSEPETEVKETEEKTSEAAPVFSVKVEDELVPAPPPPASVEPKKTEIKPRVAKRGKHKVKGGPAQASAAAVKRNESTAPALVASLPAVPSTPVEPHNP